MSESKGLEEMYQFIKKLCSISLIFMLCFCLSGCFDIFQYITRDNDGIDKITVRATVSKGFFAMVYGLSGSTDDIDYNEMFDESDMYTFDTDNYIQYGAVIERINDVSEFGLQLRMNIDYRDQNVMDEINRTSSSFIPKYNENGMTIRIERIGNVASSVEENVMTAVFLASGRYRLMISKRCIENINRAVIKTIEDEAEISFIDLYDKYLLEIPIPLLIMDDIDLILYSF